MTRSSDLFAASMKKIPGGVNSPVRAFAGVGGSPLFFRSARGAWLTDEDGREYVDYVGSWGPMIVGHAHPAVIEAVGKQLLKGLGFGAPTELELQMATRLCQLVPSMDQVRMVSSGTEATMSAIRLARGFTGRDRMIKFEGCYHGHADGLLVQAGSGALTLGVPSSPGVPAAYAALTHNASYNDLNSVAELFAQYGEEVACVIVEPVAGNMNCVPPAPGFLDGLRKLCTQHGALLIFDEVMTGFRVALGGAQALHDVLPDLTTLGKVVGGGLPVGAFGGREEIMQHLAPAGPVYQAGTLSGNPVALAAGLATLELIAEPGFHARLTETTGHLLDGLDTLAGEAGIPLLCQQAGGMFGLFFTEEKVITRFSQVQACDAERFRRFFHAMLNAGVYLAPSAYEAGFVSAAHGTPEIAHTLEAARTAFAAL